MSRIQKILLLEFWVPIVICLLLVVLYETEILLSGGMAADKPSEYYYAITMELLTICLIPFALRLFKFEYVKRQLERKADAALLYWGTIRIDMLVIPMIANTYLYYQFLHVAFGYLAIIDLISMLLIYPSKLRCEQRH